MSKKEIMKEFEVGELSIPVKCYKKGELKGWNEALQKAIKEIKVMEKQNINHNKYDNQRAIAYRDSIRILEALQRKTE